MSLPDFLVLNTGTLIYAGASGASNSFGSQTDLLTFNSLVNNAYRQGAKIDLKVDWERDWRVWLAVAWTGTPTIGLNVDVFWGECGSAVAGDANPANLSGLDADYTGYGGGTADDGIRNISQVGSLSVATATAATLQISEVGILTPKSRWGIPVVRNQSGGTIGTNTAMGLMLIPARDKIID